jgi:rod shape-determining protein MreD
MFSEILLFTIFSITFSLFMGLPLEITNYLGGALPHFILPLIVFTSIVRGPNTGLLVALIAGVFFDVSGIFPLGFHLLIFSTLAFLIGTFRSLFMIDKIIGPVIVSVIIHLIYLSMALILGTIISLIQLAMIIRVETLLEILYTAIVSPLIYFLVFKINGYLEMRPGGRYR